MGIEYDEYVMKELPKLLLKGAMSAKHANELVYKDVLENKGCRDIAFAYLNTASSYMATARAIYAVKHGSIGDEFVDDIFATFDTFASELLTNYRTDHSHQWTGIEFKKFEDAYGQKFGSIL